MDSLTKIPSDRLAKWKTKFLLRAVEKQGIKSRLVAAEVIRRASELTTERLVWVFLRVPAEDKFTVASLLEARNDLTQEQALRVETDCRRNARNFSLLGDKFHNIAINKRTLKQSAA